MSAKLSVRERDRQREALADAIGKAHTYVKVATDAVTARERTIRRLYVAVSGLAGVSLGLVAAMVSAW